MKSLRADVASKALGDIAIPDDVTMLWSAEESCPVGEPPCAGTWFGRDAYLELETGRRASG